MGIAGFGHALRFGFGEESTYGTAVARTKFIDLISESIEGSHEPIVGQGLDTAGIKAANVATGNLAYAGDVAFNVPYKDVDILWHHLLGATASAVANGVAYTHTHTPAEALPTGLTFEAFRDTSAFVGADINKAFVWAGGKINQMKLDATVGAYLNATMSVVAQSLSIEAKTAAPTLSTANLAVFTQAQLVIDGSSVATDVASFSIAVDNGLETGKRRLGSRTIFQPVRGGGKRSVTGTFVCDFTNLDQYRDFEAATSRRLVLTFTGGAITNSTATEKIVVTIPLAKTTGYKLDTGGPGQYTHEISFRAFRNNTAVVADDAEITVAVTNNLSTYGA